MRSRKAILGYAALALVQVLGIHGFYVSNVAAQSDPFVAVIVGQWGMNVCEVQDRKSDDGNWGAQSLDGLPKACEGGRVVATIMTQEEANREVARIEARSATDGSEESSVIPLSGNAVADEAAIDAEMEAIHQMLEGGSVAALDPADVAAQGQFLGFMAPEALENLPLGPQEPDTSILAAKCKDGKVGQQRRRDVRAGSPGASTTLLSEVTYKRISCARWKITSVKMTLTAPPSHHWVWFRNFYYTKAWNGSGYGKKEAGKQCRQVNYNQDTNFQPQWEIQAGGNVRVEGVDANPNLPGYGGSCWMGAGTSFVSHWIFLPGGTK